MMGSVRAVARVRAALIPPIDSAGFGEGMRAMAPLGVAIGVWGLVTGVAMVNAGVSVPLAVIMSLAAFAGSAQLAIIPLLAVGAPLPVAWATALLVNLRFVIFSAASRRFFARLPFHQRLSASYLNGDIGFALFSRRFADAEEVGTPEQWGYFFGGAVVNWVVWQVSSIAGILVGGLAPAEWGLELAALLALVAVVIPMVDRAPALAGVLVTAVLSVLSVRLPMRLGLIVSVLAGVTVAMAAESARVRTVERAQLVAGHATGNGAGHR